ncbi:hypothetical protein LOSG293_010480 [Secundilactobacillus oryzae JCM 18671]|uniref:Uncharacterized protein n=1 Tax=Secundilactobacillus oryzae JCM 18671 TaxID=1291743 RepID=A0A081BFY1_9LACO|nr:hypothetical protein [Secundilactobacillus oryzae]GAK46949.1 hypothetical protein LOSG293_010480 [Secundilactobacillus oryzae JCM 18671]
MINENDPSTLSTSGRLLAYNDAIKSGLETGKKFTELMDQLIQTTDAKELLQAATALSMYTLNSDYVTFPHQYSREDFYLLFISRMLELHGEGDAVTLQSSEYQEQLSQNITALDETIMFSFSGHDSNDNGECYQEHVTGQSLFYLNLDKQMLRFNSHAFTQLFIVQYAGQIDNEAILKAVQTFINLGNYLKKDFGFSVDFNMLDSDNSEVYEFQNGTNLSESVVDKLFVAAAEEGYMLENSEHGTGALLRLKNGAIVQVYNRAQPSQSDWVLSVHDEGQRISWFDLLVEYDFLRKWYLADLAELEIKSDPLVFA